MQHRAYSLFEIKAVREDQRLISGMASTPTPDRGGDIVEPKGVKFQNPLPLLLYHDTKRPVGSVKFGRPTDEGIPFEAHIADIAEPGPLKERVDEAWGSVKAGLLKGVSIGYRILANGAEYIRETGGLHLKSIEVFELSLVAVPMNAEATIQSIKSIDAPHLAAAGRQEPSSLAGVSAASRTVSVRSRTSMAKKTYAEQIADIDAQIQTKQSDLDALQTKVTDEGRTKDAGERETFDALNREIEALEAEKADLVKLEERAKSIAKPVVQQARAAAREGAKGVQPYITVKQNRDPGIGFARVVLCKMAAFLSQGQMSAVDVARRVYSNDPEIEAAVKTTVAGGTTTDSTWASPLAYAALSNEFIDLLRPATILGKLGTTVNGVSYPSLRRLPFNVKLNRKTAGGTGYWVGQGAPAPVSKQALDQVTMAYTKVAGIQVFSRELARFSSPSAEMLVRDDLRDVLVARLDTDFLDPDKAASAGVNPASITNGVSALTTAGTSADNVRTDVIKLMAAFQTSNLNPANLVIVMPNTLCMALSVLTTSLGTKQFPSMGVNGGYLEGIPVIASQYAASGASYGNMVVCFDASSIGLADDEEVEIDISTEAALQMLDNPTNNIDGTATSMVSMFQTDSVAVRAGRFINWAKLRSGVVQWFDDVNWGAVGSPY